MNNIVLLIISIVCLYSTDHWIGASALLAYLLLITLIPDNDPLGFESLQRALQKYRQ